MKEYLSGLSAILESYRLAYIGKENMATTAEQVVSDLRRILNRLIESYGVTVSDGRIHGVSGSVLLSWYESMVASGLAVTTRNKYVVLLNPFLRWAFNRGVLIADVQAGGDPIYAILKPARLPKEDAIPEHLRQRKFFTPQEARRFIEEMPGKQKQRDRAIVALFLASGFRAEELCSLNIGDISGDRELIYLKRKGGEWKYAEVSPFCYAYIDEYLSTREDRNDMSAPLFLTSRGTRCNRKQLWKVLSEKEKALGLKSGLHILRHTFDTEVSSKSSPEIARDLSNHKSLAITNRYIHTTHEQRRDAVGRLSWADLSPMA